MQRATRLGRLTTAIGVALVLVLGCDEQSKNTLSPEPFYGGWLPCIDEECTVVGTSGIAFLKDNWYHRVYNAEETSIEELVGGVTVSPNKEWSWQTEEDHIVIDLADPGGSQYQRLWVRFLDETHLQVEMIRRQMYDKESKEMVEIECHEDDQFEQADAGAEDGKIDPKDGETPAPIFLPHMLNRFDYRKQRVQESRTFCAKIGRRPALECLS